MVRPENSVSSALKAATKRQRYQFSPPWNPARAIFRGVDVELAVGQPAAGGDQLGRGHLARHRLRHAVVEVHDVKVGSLASSVVVGPASGRGRVPAQSALLKW